MATGEKKMEETKKNPVLVTEVEVTQSVMNLDNGVDVDIVFSQKKFEVNPEVPTREVLAVLEKAVPEKERAAILADALSKKSYRDQRGAALAKGNYLTRELRSKISTFMLSQSQYAEKSAKECFDLWKTGFLAKKPGAQKILDYVRADEDQFTI